MELTDRIRAALDETERVAREAWQENWRWYAEDKTVMTHGQDGEWEGYRTVGTRADAEHIALHDPERVLRMVAAHRKILDAWVAADAEAQKDPYEKSVTGYWEGLDTAVAALAEAYGVEA
jgi:hypothetical protein